MDGNTKKRKALKIYLLVLCLFILSFLFFRYVLEFGSWKGTSFEKYRDKAYTRGSFSLTELPKGAQDFRWQCYNFGLAAYSYAGFTLSGIDYDDFTLLASNTEGSTEEDKERFIGKKVSDTLDYYDDYGAYIGFPQRKCTYVIDDSIEDYTILYYDSYHGAGSHTYAVIVNPDTGRFVVINSGSN